MYGEEIQEPENSSDKENLISKPVHCSTEEKSDAEQSQGQSKVMDRGHNAVTPVEVVEGKEFLGEGTNNTNVTLSTTAEEEVLESSSCAVLNITEDTPSDEEKRPTCDCQPLTELPNTEATQVVDNSKAHPQELCPQAAIAMPADSPGGATGLNPNPEGGAEVPATVVVSTEKHVSVNALKVNIKWKEIFRTAFVEDLYTEKGIERPEGCVSRRLADWLLPLVYAVISVLLGFWPLALFSVLFATKGLEAVRNGDIITAKRYEARLLRLILLTFVLSFAFALMIPLFSIMLDRLYLNLKIP